MVTTLARFVFWLLQAGVLVMLAYSWIPIVIRLLFARRFAKMAAADAARPAARETPFLVLIPAHNEAAVIGKLLDSLRAQRYPRDLLDVVVVADNSHDDTAAIVRAAGFDCHERFTTAPSSKGQALAWLWACLVQSEGVPSEAVIVIIDADCTVDADYFAHLDRAFAAGARIVQSDRAVVGLGTSPITSVEAAAEELRQQIGCGVRRLLRLSASLCGSGIAMRRAVFDELIHLDTSAETITEDMAWQHRLIGQGRSIEWCPNAHLRYEAVRSMGEFRKQRNRWVGGRMRGIVRDGLPLFWSGLRLRDATRLDQGFNLMQPPRSVVVVLALFCGALALSWPGGPFLPAWCWLVLAASFGLHLLIGFILLRAPLRAYAGLFVLPLIVGQVALISVLTTLGLTTNRWEAVQHGTDSDEQGDTARSKL